MSRRDAFERIVDALNGAMLDDARWPATAALIDTACGARGSVFTFGDEPAPGEVELYFARTCHRGEDRSDWQREYFEHYHAMDEHLPRLRALPDSRIVHIAELFSDEERKTSITFNEGLPRFAMQNGLNVRLDGPGGSRIVWGTADPVDSAGWVSSRVEMVARLLPHLRQYVRVRSALAEARALGASAAALLDNTRAGVVQLDRRGRIVAANDSAGELLRLNDGLSDESGVLRAGGAEDDARLQGLLARALPRGGGAGASGSMLVRRPSSRPRFVLHVKPVAGGEEHFRSWRVAALVLIVDPVRRLRLDTARVAALLGLSPAEAAIAVSLAEGRTVREIAAATGREYATVRTHLKRVFAKLGVSRQYDAVQVVVALSQVAGSRD